MAEIEGTIGKSLQFRVHDVLGDGHCFFRSLYRIIRSNEKARKVFHIEVDDENLGVQIIRSYVANVLRSNKDKKAIDSINMR